MTGTLRLAAVLAVSTAAYGWLVAGSQGAAEGPPVGSRGGPATAPATAPSSAQVRIAAAHTAPAPAAPASDLSGARDHARRHPSLSDAWLAAHGFAQGPARQRLWGLLDGHAGWPVAPRHTLGMAPSAEAQVQDGSQPARWPAQERYAHARLPVGLADGEDAVILRWRRLDDGAVIELSAQAVAPQSREPVDVWMHRSQDWPSGRYRLEVVSANPRLELLAAGDFDIVPAGQPVTAFAYPLVSGQGH